jgi:hypothetical protein
LRRPPRAAGIWRIRERAPEGGPWTAERESCSTKSTPLKLSTDVGSAVASLDLLWSHELALGLLVGFLPPIVASGLIMGYADLEGLRRSSAGRYVRRYMKGSVQALRLVGNAVMMVGAWYHATWALALGLVLILLALSRGLLFPGSP